MDFAQAKLFSDKLLADGPIAGWEILEYVSHGKSAVVMKASRNQNQAIIKIFHPELMEQYGKEAQLIRISRERSLVGKEHPNMVRILDAGTCENTGHLFVVMSIATGRPLSQALNLVPRSNIPALIEQLARAAMQLENWGFTHRDIKPCNIHIDDTMDNLTLLDFGVMKPHGDDSATLMQVSKSFVGTHQYSPPEMIHGREENTMEGWRAISFYQIGAVLHDLIERKPIFQHATTRNANLVAAIDGEPVVVKADDVDSQICSLATRCLLKKPLERLELVHWEDFMFSEQASLGPSRQTRINALHQKAKLGFVMNRISPIEDGENRRLISIRVSAVTRSARVQFDQALAELDSFMPQRRTDIHECRYPIPAIVYSFEPAPKLGITEPFRIQIAINLQDDRDIIDVYTRASKGHDDTEVGWTHLGPALETLDGFSDNFQDWMLTILEELVSE
jgi:serine/threonine protein kinase